MSPALILLVAATQAPSAPDARYSLAVDCAVTVSAEAKKGALVQFKGGEALILSAKWSEAEGVLRKAVALDPLLAIAHYGLGQTYMSQRRFKEAVEAFSTSRDAFRCVSWSEEDKRRRAEAISEMKDAIRKADIRRLQELGVRYKELNGDVRTPGDKLRSLLDAERRVELLEAALKEANPAPLEVTLALGTALFQIGAIKEAEVEFRAVLARDPHSGDAHHDLALVLTITDRLDEAEWEMALALKAGVPVDPRLKAEFERRKGLRNPR
jgi:Flp pilus assembly protein TadD